MKNIIKAFIIPLLTGVVYCLHGKIVFYDGTYVVGKVTKVDEATVYIVPIGLDTAEGVLVGNIDSLKMENGMVPVINSAVKYFYQNGEFLANDDDWMDEYDDFQYDDYAILQEELQYEEIEKSHMKYYQLSTFGGIPIYTAYSLEEDDGSFDLPPNLGFSFQLPYYPIGAIDVSPGFRAMTFSFDASKQGLVKAIQLAATASIDFKPVFYFLPNNIHVSSDLGLSYSLGYDIDQNPGKYPNLDLPEGNAIYNAVYNGVGLNFGASFDYWMPNAPIAFKFFANNYIIPQAPPFTDIRTFFSHVGLSLVVVLKRHHSGESASNKN
ncbi:MAG: hypothetical protein ACJZ12_01910 [Candidatus Neomarinimicrobiota bacterium]